MSDDAERFRRHLDEASRIVSTWPEWKRNILGRPVAKHSAATATHKIAELPKACSHPQHDPPSHMAYSPGVWQHTCPACGASKIFTVRGATL